MSQPIGTLPIMPTPNELHAFVRGLAAVSPWLEIVLGVVFVLKISELWHRAGRQTVVADGHHVAR